LALISPLVEILTPHLLQNLESSGISSPQASQNNKPPHQIVTCEVFKLFSGIIHEVTDAHTIIKNNTPITKKAT
jgi:hypothetical protein